MRPEELRIGNLLEDFFGNHTVVVTADMLLDIKRNIKFHPPRQIKLTEEWFERSNFEKRDNFWVSSFGIWFEQVNDEFYILYFIDGNKRLRKVKHVHDWQNIVFTLTGAELTIKEVVK